ncbi:NfeD-like partner-binding protein [Paenibacillus taihuensis]|uniref:NfeD-like partner-binding protein n=1 Tax=Paenibacillus taihuensis TaxID=1156355 RepID=A0A3D9S6N5_9BACL|nr:NfeD family protein [Paenibacillus taihuensis]REE88664.1 NfeD-like partner-binding protein [Paenibacillus taihuensis]
MKGGRTLEGVFIGCLVGGVLFALVSVVLGDWLSASLDGMLDFLSFDGYPVLQPTAIVSGITVFGGAGLLLSHHTSLGSLLIIFTAIVIGLAAAVAMFFFYVRPMARSENSTSYSMKELTGAIGEVSVTIPGKGYGEVLIKVGAGLTNHIASSVDGDQIPAGERIVVVNVEGHTLHVSKLEL